MVPRRRAGGSVIAVDTTMSQEELVSQKDLVLQEDLVAFCVPGTMNEDKG